MRCDQCGRVGTRGFRTFGGGVAEFVFGLVEVPAVTECTGKVACRRRQWRSIPVERRARLLSDEY